MRPAVLAGVTALASVLAFAVLAADPTHPPPGDYRIDSEAVMTSQAGPLTLRTVQTVDGTTGVTQVEQSASDGATSRQTYPGQGPNRWCVRTGGAPPPGATACVNRSFEATPGGGSTQQAVCAGGSFLVDAWRRSGDGTWERRFEARPAPVASGPVDPRTRAAMAPVIAQIEEVIRSGPPDEAEAARQQLAALRASLGGGAAAGGMTVSVRETWTRISDRCG